MMLEGDEGWTWSSSLTKARVNALLWSGDIPLTTEEMPAREVYRLEPLFQLETKEERFAARLRALRKSIAAEIRHNNDHAQGLRRDRYLFPNAVNDNRGRPHYQGSEAEAVVKDMVKASFVRENGKRVHKPELMEAPEQRHNPTWPFDLQEFKKRIGQEVRTQKWYNYREMKAKKKQQEATKKAKKAHRPGKS